MAEENIVYDVILRPGSARERHEIARFIEELMPLRRTQAFTCARRYLWATSHTVAINGWSPLPPARASSGIAWTEAWSVLTVV